MDEPDAWCASVNQWASVRGAGCDMGWFREAWAKKVDCTGNGG
jgi:hypothetical protein